MRAPFLTVVILGFAQGALAQQPDAAVAREAYRANLTACVSLAKACDRDRLTRADRDYLSYEVGAKRFTRQEVQEVVGVRMAWLGKETETAMGEATGHWPKGRRGSSSTSGETSASALASSGSFGCSRHASGYYRSNGTYVNGYDRRC